MELGPSPSPGAVPSCRDGCLHLPASTQPRLPALLGTRAQNRDGHRAEVAVGWFILSQCCGAAGAIVDAEFYLMQGHKESWPWGSAGSMQPLMVQLGVPGTQKHQSQCWCHPASARCGVQQQLCSACRSGVQDDPEMAAPGAALPGHGYAVPGRGK